MPASTPAWYVISLRPRGTHEPLRRAAAKYGAGLIALSPWRIRVRDDRPTRADLRAALSASRVVFTSPAAVRAAQALRALKPRRGQHWCAVGAGTAAALRRAGVAEVHAPERMDSEGLLALAVLQEIDGETVGLVTAPGGRGEIAPTLQARGARLLRADVYVREPVALSPQSLRRLCGIDAPMVLALSSGEALQRVLDIAPAAARTRLRRAAVVAASARLVALARGQGFRGIVQASGPRPADLVAAAAAWRRTRGHPVA